MAGIGDLAVVLKADATQLTSGLASASRGLQSFANETKGKLSAIPFFGGIAAGAMITNVGGFEKMVTAGLDKVAARAKEADALGISMKDVAGMELLAGDKAELMAHGLRHLGAELGAMKAGIPEVIDKFGKLGLSTDLFKGKDVAGAYRVVADEIAKKPDFADRARLAHELMGKSGMELVGILAKGGGAVDAFGAKAVEFGQIVDRDVAQKAIDAKRAIDNLRKSMGQLGEQAAVTTAPALKTGANWLTSIMKHPGNPGAWAGLIRPNPMEPFTEAGRKAAAIKEAKDDQALARAKELYEQQKKAFDLAKSQTDRIQTLGMKPGEAEGFRAKRDLPMADTKNIVGRDLAFDAVHEATVGAKNAIDDYSTRYEKLIALANAGKLGADAKANAEAFEDAAKALKRLADEAAKSKVADIIKETRTPLEQFNAAMEDAIALNEAKKLSDEDLARFTKKTAQDKFGAQTSSVATPSAVYGSSGAASAFAGISNIGAASSTGNLANLLQKQTALQERGNAQAKDMLDQLRAINAAMRDGGTTVINFDQP